MFSASFLHEQLSWPQSLCSRYIHLTVVNAYLEDGSPIDVCCREKHFAFHMGSEKIPGGEVRVTQISCHEIVRIHPKSPRPNASHELAADGFSLEFWMVLSFEDGTIW